MRLLLLICFCFLLPSCNSGGNSNANCRTYVISQSQEAAAETDLTVEQPVD